MPEARSQSLRSSIASPVSADVDKYGAVDRIDLKSNEAMEHADIFLTPDGGPARQLPSENNEEGIKELLMVDLNADGALDVVPRLLTIKTDRDNVSWIEDWGGAEFSKPQRILTFLERGTLEIALGDVDLDDDIDVIVHSSPGEHLVWYENTTHAAPDTPVGRPGDANGDGHFDPFDMVAVLQAGKYSTGEPVTAAEGDWRGDGVFDWLDMVIALAFGVYLISYVAFGLE